MRFDEAGFVLVYSRTACFAMNLNFERTLLREVFLWLGDHEQLYHEIFSYTSGNYVSVETHFSKHFRPYSDGHTVRAQHNYRVLVL